MMHISCGYKKCVRLKDIFNAFTRQMPGQPHTYQATCSIAPVLLLIDIKEILFNPMQSTILFYDSMIL